MIQVATLRRRSWAGVAWLLIVAGLLAALALGNTFVVFAAVAASAVGVLALLRAQAPLSASPRSAAARGGEAAQVAGAAREQRSVLLADGTPRQALVVPAAAADGYQTVLTMDGYALVNGEGRVVYALNRPVPAPADEPVVVTILDAG